MADNYLEKKFEEYASRKSESKVKKIFATGPRPGQLDVKFPPRRVFVTGGAAGIGKAVVKAFRDADCRVAFCDVDTKNGPLTAQQTGARFYPLDVCDSAALTTCLHDIFATWGDIDILINNVGISRFSPLTETSIEEFDRIIATNLRPTFITARELARHRRSLPEPPAYGRIVNITSTRYLMSEPGSEGYAASKGGIYSLTHALALSLAPLHITVNSIAPGWIENGNYEALRPEDHAQHPSGRVGRPDDIARMCLFLCQEENDFINGENITIDGGMTKKMIYIE